MPLSIFAVIFAFTTTACISQAFPVSPNHRFAVYTPYWHEGSQPHIPQEFAKKRLTCGTGFCNIDRNFLLDQGKNELSNTIPIIKTTKRNKNLYKTGWTMGGMPFSVLYMNPKPKISVRSPVAEPLRSLPQHYDNGDMREPGFIPDSRFDDLISEVHTQPLTSGLDNPEPTLIPTRRQYSIIPQLFVSYGWGPLGK